MSRMTGLSAFAPSWEILRPALALRKAGKETAQTWHDYTSAYLAEMRVSYTQRRTEWDTLLNMPKITLLCYCTAKYLPRCHRVILAHLLTRLDKSAVYLGELA